MLVRFLLPFYIFFHTCWSLYYFNLIHIFTNGYLMAGFFLCIKNFEWRNKNARWSNAIVGSLGSRCRCLCRCCRCGRCYFADDRRESRPKSVFCNVLRGGTAGREKWQDSPGWDSTATGDRGPWTVRAASLIFAFGDRYSSNEGSIGHDVRVRMRII